MENHVHLIAVPRYAWSLTRGIGEANRKYASTVNIRENWRGHLWQERFASYPLDERHLFKAVRYIERNPVMAGIVSRAEHYAWSSAKAHVDKTNDPILSNSYLLAGIEDWSSFLKEELGETDIAQIQDHESSGRPLGKESFVRDIEVITGRFLLPRKRGRKKGN
jgi:putative transposase